MKTIITLPALLVAVATTAHAEMVSLDEGAMADVAGQGGVYLSGEFSINKDGGPLWTADPNGAVDDFGNAKEYRNCGTAQDPKECGLRLAVKLNENSEGWYVLDDLAGGMAFEGLTLRTINVDSATNYDVWDSNTGDFAEEAVNDEVVQIGLPGTVSFRDFKFKFAVANNGEYGVPTVDGNGDPVAFRQTEIFGVELNGNVTLEGNLLLFPVE